MKKELIFILLSICFIQNAVFATVQKTANLNKGNYQLPFEQQITLFLLHPSIDLEATKDTNKQTQFKNDNNIAKIEKKGVFLANFSFWTIIFGVAGLLLLGTLPKSVVIASSGWIFPVFTPLGNFLLLLFWGGLLLSFIIGVISLMKLKHSTNKMAKIKAGIGVAPLLILFLLFFLSMLGM
jgi:hypothetical protein